MTTVQHEKAIELNRLMSIYRRRIEELERKEVCIKIGDSTIGNLHSFVLSNNSLSMSKETILARDFVNDLRETYKKVLTDLEAEFDSL